ncbi:hypothetical protein Syun_003288 [Stephania yunnanensis]|uniref:Uncharacterized protein n=1 Tax=Stephania yunnanensis TaxID=152371 RepID=A0AAP0Q3R6_9MAGN
MNCTFTLNTKKHNGKTLLIRDWQQFLKAEYERRHVELAQVDPDTPINNPELFYKAVGVNKSRVYGLGFYGDSSYETL